MGNEHAVCAAIERIQDMIGGAGWRADKDGEAACPRRHHTGINIAPVKGRVFSINAQAIKAARRQHLHDMGMRGFEEGAEQRLAVRDTGFEGHPRAYHNRALAIAAPSASVASLA